MAVKWFLKNEMTYSTTEDSFIKGRDFDLSLSVKNSNLLSFLPCTLITKRVENIFFLKSFPKSSNFLLQEL